MGLKAYRINPRPGGGFHFGREGLDQEVSAESFPSDSLFAALVAAFISVEGAANATAFVEPFLTTDTPQDMPFRLSSLFPRAGDLPLLPMPRVRVNLQTSEDRTRGKALKRIAYVSPGILRHLLNHDVVDRFLPSDSGDSDGLMLQDGKVWITREERSLLPGECQKKNPLDLREWAVWTNDTVPRVTIDRMSNSSTIFQVGRTVFNEGCGLWLLADVNQQGDWLEYLLDILGDQGIGGEHSSGYGGFTVEPLETPTLPSPDNRKQVVTLSRYNPTDREIAAGVLGKRASYELVDIGGWLAAPGSVAQRRKRVRMIEAGSILEAAQPIVGRVVDVRPEYEQPGAPNHPVYRSGLALPIGMSGGAG